MPNVKTQSFQTEWLWLIVNIPLEATKSTIDGGNIILPYIPPHPPKGTKYHRYTVAVFEQPSQIGVNQVKAERIMDVREFVKDYNLTIRGASFFREVWDEEVTKIYQEILGVREPVYGPPPKVNPYLDETGSRMPKYVNL
ncbi:1314_t:CDS:2, partial [Paraglomus occultum]